VSVVDPCQLTDFERATRLAQTDTSSLEVHPTLALRSRRIGHSASLMIFSAIDPKTVGLQPQVSCVEITTMSMCSRSITIMIFPTTSFPTSTREVACTPIPARW
jgi:hypothetical protein